MKMMQTREIVPGMGPVIMNSNPIHFTNTYSGPADV
jgi:hypothetical protein